VILVGAGRDRGWIEGVTMSRLIDEGSPSSGQGGA
jgi:hypothetical protein